MGILFCLLINTGHRYIVSRVALARTILIRNKPKERSLMSTQDTGVQCIVCKAGNIVAEMGSEPLAPMTSIPIGPGSEGYFRETCQFHCPQCGVSFHHPPGQANWLEEWRAKQRQAEYDRETAASQEQVDRFLKHPETQLLIQDIRKAVGEAGFSRP